MVLVRRTAVAHRPNKRWTAVAVAAVLVGALAGCQQAEAEQEPRTPTTSASATPAESATAASLRVTPEPGAEDVRPDTPVVITASGGRVSEVVVTSDEGAQVAGETSLDGKTWTSEAMLAPETTYTVVATAVNPDALRSPHESSFTTLEPKDVETASFQPKDGWNVGVGMPVIVHFDAAVQDRAAVEKRLLVTSSPRAEGSWRWLSDKQAQWRPRDYWKPGTKVTVEGDLSGIEVAPDIWGVRADPVNFTVGSAMVSTVDIGKHTMTVTKDGKVLKTIPITTGKQGFATRIGTKVIISRESSHQMDAATTGIKPGDPEYYNLNVKYAMRLTWTGEFVHAAPWSTGSQGRANVSHGCTGMSTANAKWLMDNSKVGDVVHFVNGSRKLEQDNGWTAWNVPFEEWTKGSALTG